MALKIAQLMPYIIGLSLILTVYFNEEFKKQLPQKKVLGFPLLMIGYPFLIYFSAVILWILIK